MNISDKIQFAILIVTLLVAIATFISTYFNYKSISLYSRPTLKIEAVSIIINPEIKLENDNELLVNEKERYCISISLNISNIGNNPAQNISIDGEVFFKASKPFNYKSLPIHLPIHFNILESKSLNQHEINTSINFDNYIAKTILYDHINNFKKGISFLPYKNEMNNPNLWPSPKIKVKCYYSDIINNNYCSEIELFFYGYVDKDSHTYKLRLLNMFDLNFAKVSKISTRKRNTNLIKSRDKRHISFWGIEYPKNELITIITKRE